MIFTGKTYDFLKWIAQVVLPALGTLYFTIDQLADWNHGTLVSGIILAFDTFLGVILGLSTMQYNKQQSLLTENKSDGDLIISQDGEETYYALGISNDAYKSIPEKTTVTLNVVQNKPTAD